MTELEDYIKCGYRYYHRWVLCDLPPEEPDDDAAPDMAGRAVHNILARFFARLGPHTERISVRCADVFTAIENVDTFEHI